MFYFKIKNKPVSELYAYKGSVVENLVTGEKFHYPSSSAEVFLKDYHWVICDKDGSPLEKDKTFIRVIKILEQQLGMPKEDIHTFSTKDSLGTDSLDEVEFIINLEEEFDLEIQDSFNMVSDIVYYIKEKEAISLKKFTLLAEEDEKGEVKDLRDKLSLRKKKLLKKESKASQWSKPISERKFNRCVDQYCINIQKDFSGNGLDIYYNPETETVYRALYDVEDKMIYVSQSLNKCKDHKIYDKYKGLYQEYCPWENGDLGCDKKYVEVVIPDDIKNSNGGFVTLEESRARREADWTDKHYSFMYKLTEKDIEKGEVKIDPYFVNELWKLNEKDSTGIIFHNLKTIARWTDKNSEEREIRALYGQIKRLAEMRGIEL